MIQPTNREVRDAINKCIEERWIPLSKGAPFWKLPGCALCNMWNTHWRDDEANFAKKCPGCPIYEYNPRKQCDRNSSPYAAFRHALSPEAQVAAAEDMVKFLEQVREHFFGGMK